MLIAICLPLSTDSAFVAQWLVALATISGEDLLQLAASSSSAKYLRMLIVKLAQRERYPRAAYFSPSADFSSVSFFMQPASSPALAISLASFII